MAKKQKKVKKNGNKGSFRGLIISVILILIFQHPDLEKPSFTALSNNHINIIIK
jgi:hypothetical protein